MFIWCVTLKTSFSPVCGSYSSYSASSSRQSSQKSMRDASTASSERKATQTTSHATLPSQAAHTSNWRTTSAREYTPIIQSKSRYCLRVDWHMGMAIMVLTDQGPCSITLCLFDCYTCSSALMYVQFWMSQCSAGDTQLYMLSFCAKFEFCLWLIIYGTHWIIDNGFYSQ